MPNRYRQTGAFILVTVVFLMAAGGAMLYAMANFSTASSTTATLVHNGNMALAAAQSGLKYCLLVNCPDALTNQDFSGIPCRIDTEGNCNVAATPSICTIKSTAICPSVTSCPNVLAPDCGKKILSIQVQKTAGGYQMIPASRQVLPLP